MNICLVLIEYPVSFVNGRFINDFAGGAGVVMYDIAHGLQSKGHKVSVLARTIYPSHTGSFSDHGINVYKFHAKDKTLETMNITNFLHEIIRTANIEIVETCDYAPLIFDIPDGVPLLVRQHVSHGLINLYQGTTSTPYDKNDPDCLKRSFQIHLGDSFAGVSKFILNKQAQFHRIPHDKIYGVIYNGIRNIERNGCETNKDVLFCHGTVSKRKGTDKVCRIYNQVKKEELGARLRIIGNGSAFWKNSCATELADVAQKDCFYSEYLGHDDVISEISGCGIYISMSNLEAMSISLVEALRLGKPAILLKNGAFEEIVEDGVEGFLIETEKEAVSRVVELLRSEETYTRMSIAAHEKSRQFTIEKCVSDTENWYTHVIKNKDDILSKRSVHFHELLKEHYALLSKTTII